MLATAVVLSVVAGPLPLVPLGGRHVAPAAATTCTVAVDAATAAPDAAAGTAALQDAVDAAATADPGCAAWTVALTGTFVLTRDLVHATALPLVLEGSGSDRAELRGDGSARLVTLLRPATELTLRRVVLRGGDADGGDLAAAGGAVAAEPASIADPTPSRVSVVDALLVDSSAASGGALAADHVVLTDVDLVGNAAPLGGAVDAAEVTATRTQFLGNAATLAPGQGGAIRASGDVTLTTVTLAGNTAVAGGSVWLSGAADPVLRATATTFADARADAGGHVLADLGLGGSVRVVLRGSVLAGVTALGSGAAPAVCTDVTAHAGPDPDATVATLATDASCPGAVVLGSGPTLTPLDAVEGRDRLVAPAAAGPLVDVAACTDVWPAVDARGVARPQPAAGRCDAGAVELEAPTPAPPDPPSGGGAADPPAPVVASDPPVDPLPVPAAVRAGAAPPAAAPAVPGWRDLLRLLRRR